MADDATIPRKIRVEGKDNKTIMAEESDLNMQTNRPIFINQIHLDGKTTNAQIPSESPQTPETNILADEDNSEIDGAKRVADADATMEAVDDNNNFTKRTISTEEAREEAETQLKVRPIFSKSTYVLILGVLVSLILALVLDAMIRRKHTNVDTTGSTSFIRWGRTDCANTTGIERIYSGFAAGSLFDSPGSGSNILCLHDTPGNIAIKADEDNERAKINGVEFRTSDFPPLSQCNNYDMVCTACRVATRGTMIMIPARSSCPPTWTTEYNGYLMSSRRDHLRSEFICVDREPDLDPKTKSVEKGFLLYPVEGRCLNSSPGKRGRGGLPCDKFPDFHELSCVVCTK